MFEQNVTLGPGTGTTTQHTFEILIMLLGAALLGLWLGWILWNKYKQQVDQLKTDILSLTATTDAQRTELNNLKIKLTGLETDHANVSTQLVSLQRNNNYQRDKIGELEEDLARVEARNRQLETELGLSFDPDQSAVDDIPLEINVPGAEPATETPTDTTRYWLDEDADDMADEPLEALDLPPLDVAPVVPVDDDGQIHDAPSLDLSAPAAATATDEGAADETLLHTPALEGDLTPTAEAPIVVVPMAETGGQEAPSLTPSLLLNVTDQKDDLTVIEGIGPKIQELLFQYGIRSYRQLAATDVTRIKEILRSAGPQLAMHDPGTWTAQALLAANDQWDNLKAYQDYLSAGKAPRK